MIKPSWSRSTSFRKPEKKVAEMPPTIRSSSDAWRPKINERVQTPSGIGTVVEISENMYLIDLENQVAKIWERLTSIKRPK
jgi:hypothetical protein